MLLCFVFVGVPASLREALGDEARLEPSEHEMQHMLDAMPTWLMSAKSTNTTKKYHSYFNRFRDFMLKHNKVALPARSIDVALFCTYLLECHVSKHVMNSYVYSIKYMHGLHNFIDPTECSHVKNLQECSKRFQTSQSCKKDVITSEVITNLFKKYVDCKDIPLIRDLTMIIVAFTGFLRYDELSSILCKDVTFHDDSYVKICITKSKTDQYRDGNEILLSKIDSVACPYTMLQKYVKTCKLDMVSPVYLFKAVFKTRHNAGLRKQNKKLSYSRTKEVLLGRLREVAPKGLNLGLHSLRAGGATAAANANVNDRCWRRHGRWKSDVAHRYVKDSIDSRLSVSKSLGL